MTYVPTIRTVCVCREPTENQLCMSVGLPIYIFHASRKSSQWNGLPFIIVCVESYKICCVNWKFVF